MTTKEKKNHLKAVKKITVWEKHFKRVSDEKLMLLHQAVSCLVSDTLVDKEFPGLSSMGGFIEAIIERRRKNESNREKK